MSHGGTRSVCHHGILPFCPRGHSRGRHPPRQEVRFRDAIPSRIGRRSPQGDNQHLAVRRSLPHQPSLGDAPTPLRCVVQLLDEGGQATRRRWPSPATDCRAGHQSPTSRVPPREEKPHPQEGARPVSSTISPDGQLMIHLPSYASVVAQSASEKMNDSAAHGRWQLVKRRRHPTPERRPVNPNMERRCYLCLARDHRAQTCRESVRCRQAGHQQYVCPRATQEDARPEPPQRAPSGLYAFLVG